MKRPNFTIFYLVITCLSLTWLVSCKENEPDTIKAPDALVYAPNNLTLTQGTAGSSVAPTIQGTAPITYSDSVSPASAGITINAQGVIAVANTVLTGTYAISVTASNSAGNKTFANAYTVTISAVATPPSALAYTPNSLTLVQGTTNTSAVPTIQGTAPLTYALVVSPAAAGITVNTQGAIAVANTVAVGNYSIKVNVTNSTGTVEFPNAYTITVSAAATPPSALAYAPNS